MEIEVKYNLLDPKQGMGILLDIIGKDNEGLIRTIMMNSVYYDTPEKTLKKQNSTLRLRHENEKCFLTYKTAPENKKEMSFREEWEYETKSLYRGISIMPDRGNLDLKKIKSGELLLIPVATIEIIRKAVDVDIGDGCLVELCVDNGTMIKRNGNICFAELEAELKQGYNIKAFSDFGNALAQKHRLLPQTQSKLQRAYDI